MRRRRVCFSHHFGEHVFVNISRTVLPMKKTVITVFVENLISYQFYLKLFFVKFIFFRLQRVEYEL